MRLRLTPRDTTFFDLFSTLAAHLVTGADLLAQIVGAEPVDRSVLADRLRDAEHDADDATHSIMRRLNQTFVTPFDRDDIYALSSALDDCMDFMEAAGAMIVLYAVEDLPAGVNDQIATLQRAAELTADAMPRLRSMEGLEEYWIEINRLENEGDRAYRGLTALLFSDPAYQESPAGVVEMLKLKGVVDSLEDAADSFEHVANTIETIFLKES
jgi:predicted phosphate transport protein (TIGR00153 family)